jgi:hypothetical protein
VGQAGGSIRASVLDENGGPVSGAIVTFMRQPRGSGDEELTNCFTDQTGTCTAWKLRYGKYSATAANPRDGYPDSHGANGFYAGSYPKTSLALLSAKDPSQAVELHMPKKAGFIDITAVDGATGKPLNAKLEFHWVSSPKNGFACDCMSHGQSRLLIPAETPVTMLVTRKGYDDWTYALGRGELRDAILLHAGEELSLDVQMWPKQ